MDKVSYPMELTCGGSGDRTWGWAARGPGREVRGTVSRTLEVDCVFQSHGSAAGSFAKSAVVSPSEIIRYHRSQH